MSYNGKHQTTSKSECVYKRSESDSAQVNSSSSRTSSSSSPSLSSSLLRRLLLSTEGLDGSSGPTLKREVIESTLKLKHEEEDRSGGGWFAVDGETMRRLESEKVINWSDQLRKQYPITTLALSEDDGQRRNGLLESISLLLWGSDAAAYLLSRLLFVMLVEVGPVQLRPRWTRHRKRSHRRTDLDIEWTILVNSVHATNQSSDVGSVVPLPSHDLHDSLYVFALANIIRRPIIIVDDQNHTSDSVVNEFFSGVYLPLLSDADSCSFSPLLLVHHKGCFLPLVERETDSRDRIGRPFFPIASGNMEPLVVRFLTKAEEGDPSALLERYLSIKELTLMTRDKKLVPDILCAALYSDYHEVSDETDNPVRVSGTKHVLYDRGLASELNLMDSSIHALSTKGNSRNEAPSLDTRQSTTRLSESEEAPCPADSGRSVFAAEDISRPCAAPNCEYFGRWETDWLCSRCQRTRDSGHNDRLKRTTSDHSAPHPSLGSHVNSQFSSGARNSGLALATGFERNYLDMISHQEKQIEQLAYKCRSFSCYNFGNAKCGGSCHACHKIMTKR